MSRRNSRDAKARRRAERELRRLQTEHAAADGGPVATMQTEEQLAALEALDPDTVLPCGCTVGHELESSKIMRALASGMTLPGHCDHGDCRAVPTCVLRWADDTDSYMCAAHTDHVITAADSQGRVGGRQLRSIYGMDA